MVSRLARTRTRVRSRNRTVSMPRISTRPSRWKAFRCSSTAIQTAFRTGRFKLFDGRWLEAAGLQHGQFVELVKGTITDGEVCDWVQRNARKSDAEKRAHADRMLNYPKPDDQAMQDRLKQRKEAAGLSHRDDIKSF